MPNFELTTRELLQHVGTDLGQSQPFEVEQGRIDLFADATDDHQWIHVDPERARTGPFGAPIAHGYLTLSLVPRLLEDLLELTDIERGTNYGIERARFPSPLLAGSVVRMSGVLASADERADGGIRYEVHVEVVAEGAAKTCLVADIVLLAYSE